MNTTSLIAHSLLASALLLGVGCNSKTETTTTQSPQAPAAMTDTAAKATEAVQKVTEQAKTAVAAVTDKVQELVASAKKLAGENKWEEALKLLQQAKGMQLSADQQKMVDDLIGQFQQQMSQAAASKAADAAAGAAAKGLDGLMKK